MRIKAAFLALLCAFIIGLSPSHAQFSKSTLNSQVSQNFPDQNTGAITPAVVRTFFNNIISSFQQYLGVNAQVGTTYTVQTSDYGQLVTFNNAAPVAVTLPGAGSAGFFPFNFLTTNLGAGTVTITPTIGTINGLSSLTIFQGQGSTIVSDGTNWQVFTTAGNVFSFNGRTGVVVPATGDYTTQQLTPNTSGTRPACGSGKLGEVCSITSVAATAVATFSNGSSTIGIASGSPQVGTTVIFTTSGALPTNFAVSTNYYVLTSTVPGGAGNITVSATPGGAAILAGSAGSGTQTYINESFLPLSTAKDIGYLSLAAGDWSCTANVVMNAGASTTVTVIRADFTQTSNTIGAVGNPGTVSSAGPFTTGGTWTMFNGGYFVATAAPLKVYVDATATFGVANMFAYGTLTCMRTD